MGPRNLLILFFSTIAVSLVILIIFFSLFFKNVDLTFDTKMPESAPELRDRYKNGGNLEGEGGLFRSNINVPSEFRGIDPSAVKPGSAEAPAEEEEEVSETDEQATTETEQQEAPTPDTAPVPDSHDDQDRAPARPEPAPAPKPELPKPQAPKPAEPKPDLQPVVPPATPTGKKDSGGGSYQVYMDGFGNREAAAAKAAEVGGVVRQQGSGYVVQMGVFSSKENADSMANKSGAKVRAASR